MHITANSGFLLQVARDAGAGKLVPAAFQRPYAWTRHDVEAFWASIMARYPLGSLLLWEPKDDVDLDRLSRGRIGPVAADRDAYPGIILDGQNRLASYAWSCRAHDDPSPFPDDLSDMERATWASGMHLVADCRTETIRFVDAETASDPHCFAPGMLASTDANPVFRRHDKLVKFTDREANWLLGTIPDAIREARVIVTMLERASPEEALDAFRHIARAGVPMSDEDFEAAMAWALPSKSPVP